MATPAADLGPRLRVVKGGADSGPSAGGHEGLSDEALVQALRQGDGQKAAILYDRLIRVVDATLVRILGKREQDHDDLVQSVFEQIVLALNRGHFSGGGT